MEKAERYRSLGGALLAPRPPPDPSMTTSDCASRAPPPRAILAKGGASLIVWSWRPWACSACSGMAADKKKKDKDIAALSSARRRVVCRGGCGVSGEGASRQEQAHIVPTAIPSPQTAHALPPSHAAWDRHLGLPCINLKRKVGTVPLLVCALERHNRCGASGPVGHPPTALIFHDGVIGRAGGCVAGPHHSTLRVMQGARLTSEVDQPRSVLLFSCVAGSEELSVLGRNAAALWCTPPMPPLSPISTCSAHLSSGVSQGRCG